MNKENENNWFEVWFAEGADYWPSYLLIVRPDEASFDRFVVMDPQEDYKIIHADHSYESLRLWLLEDEFALIRGREFAGGG